MSTGHKNNGDEYYSNYIPNFEGDIVVEMTPPENVNPSDTIIHHSPCALIELDIWKVSSICAESNSSSTLSISINDWNIFSIEDSSNYNTITLEYKVLIMNLLLSLRNNITNLSNICINNIFLVGILKKEIYGIENFNVIRLLLKDDNLKTIELTIVENNFNLIKVLYNTCVSIETSSLSSNSSLIPKRPIYNLDYKLKDCKLSLVLSSPSELDIYEQVDLLGNQLTKSNLKNVLINTKETIPVEIYMNNYECKYIKVIEGQTNNIINLECISNEEFIKKNIVIKLIGFDSNNELYLSKITF